MTIKNFVVNGKKTAVGKRIGKGGEGEVYEVPDDKNVCLKVYTTNNFESQEKKISLMINRGIAQKTDLVAFPTAIATNENGAFIGFLMKLMSGHQPLHELYSPGARKQNFPNADYRFLVRTACNIARAVASVHKAGCVIGDINHSGILISPKAVAALIDADSFQVADGKNRYLCKVGVPEYTPPELQTKKLGEIIRTANHDAFGLAVVIFQLLFMGRHPFVGRYAHGEMPMEKAISEYRFAYSVLRNVGMTPPPGAALLTDFPSEVTNFFEQAFSNDALKMRPTAEAWISLLENFEKNLHQCSNNKLHHYSSAASVCPWCRMENHLGIILFMPPLSSLSFGSTVDDISFNLNVIWAQIESISWPSQTDLLPVFPLKNYSPSKEAIQANSTIGTARMRGIVSLFVGIGLYYVAPTLTIVWLAFLINGLLKFFIKPDIAAAFRAKLFQIHNNYDREIYYQKSISHTSDFERIKAKLVNAKNDYARLPKRREEKLTNYQAERRERQLDDYLDKFLIRHSKIRGIGPAKELTLASYGIESAADAKESKILAIPGFGRTNSAGLFEWRKRLESKFVYNTRPNSIDKQRIESLEQEILKEKAKLQVILRTGQHDLKAAVDRAKHKSRIPSEQLKSLYDELKQLECDLDYLKSEVVLPAPKNYAVTLNENNVRHYFGTTYSQRGDSYQKSGKVISAKWDFRTGSIDGAVQGSRPAPYQQKITLHSNLDSIKSVLCTCPMGGKCKHSAAILFDALRNGKFR